MRNYDDWILRGPDEPHEIGTQPSDECGRYHAPDEDAPRGYRPRPCGGEMIERDGLIICDTCGEIVWP